MVDSIVLFEADTTSFLKNGLGVLSNDAISCTVEEDLDGQYELNMTYPVTGLHYTDIQLTRIIFCKPNPYDDRQAFRIYYISKPMSGVITIKAQHISYDLSNYPVLPLSVTSSQGLNGAILQLAFRAGDTYERIPFTFAYPSEFIPGTFESTEPKSAKALIKDIASAYGMDLKWDNFKVTFLYTRGTNKVNSVNITYGKNLTDVTQENDYTNTYTTVYPYYIFNIVNESTEEEEERIITYSDKVIRIANVPEGGREKVLILPTNDLWSNDDHQYYYTEAYPTDEDFEEIVNDYQGVNHSSAVHVNTTVSYADLYSDPQYESFEGLETIELGDTIKVRYSELGIDASVKCRKVTYDALDDRITTIDLGSETYTLLSVFEKQNQYIESAKSEARSMAAKVTRLANKINNIDATVIKENESYLYNTSLTRDATDGDILDKISSSWLHADSKGDISTALFPGTIGGVIKPYTANLKMTRILRIYVNDETEPYSTTALVIKQFNSDIYASGDIIRTAQITGDVKIEAEFSTAPVFMVSDVSSEIISAVPDVYSAYYPIGNQPYERTSEISIGDFNSDCIIEPVINDALDVVVYSPVDETHVKEATAVFVRVIKRNFNFVMAPFYANRYLREYDNDSNPTMYRYVEDLSHEFKPLDIDEFFDIISFTVSTDLNYATIEMKLKDEFVGNEEDSIIILRGSEEISQTSTIRIDVALGYSNLIPFSDTEELDAFDTSEGAYVAISGDDAIIWHEPETITEDNDYIKYTTVNRYPYRRFYLNNYDIEWNGTIPNLMVEQRHSIKYRYTEEVDTDKRMATVGTWYSLSAPSKMRPRMMRFKALAIEDGIKSASILNVSTQYETVGGEKIHEINVDASNVNMYNLYLQLLNGTPGYYGHYFESGINNKFNEDFFHSLDIIGKNNILNFKTSGNSLKIFGDGNNIFKFENFSSGIDGVFIGNRGTGVYIPSNGSELVFYNDYSIVPIEAVTYDISLSGTTLILTCSDGTSSRVTLPEDTNTTYELTASSTTLYLTGSDGSESYVAFPEDENTTYAISLTNSTLYLTGSDGSTSTVILPESTTPETYTISISDRVITLTGSAGHTSTITLPEDSDTTYDISYSDNVLTLTGSDGSTKSVTIESGGTDISWADDNDITDSINEIFGTVLLTTEDSNTIITEDDYPIGV